MEKRGLSHIEFILAFILFIGALIFALSLFNPSSSSKLTSSNLDTVFNAISNNASTSFISYTIKLNDTKDQIQVKSGAKALVIDLSDVSFISGIPLSKFNIMVENSSNKRPLIQNIGIKSSSQYLCLSFKENSSMNYQDFLVQDNVTYLYFSDDNMTFPLDGSVTSNTNCNNVNFNSIFYDPGSFYNYSIISERRLISLSRLYSSGANSLGYNRLKSQLQLSPGINFGFILKFADGSSITADKSADLKSVGNEILSSTKRVEVLRESGDRVFADFNVKIW